GEGALRLGELARGERELSARLQEQCPMRLRVGEQRLGAKDLLLERRQIGRRPARPGRRRGPKGEENALEHRLGRVDWTPERLVGGGAGEAALLGRREVAREGGALGLEGQELRLLHLPERGALGRERLDGSLRPGEAPE